MYLNISFKTFFQRGINGVEYEEKTERQNPDNTAKKDTAREKEKKKTEKVNGKLFNFHDSIKFNQI